MQAIQQLRRLPSQQPLVFLLLATVVWFVSYRALIPASEALVAWLPLERDSHLGGALQFFFYDTPKVLLLDKTRLFCPIDFKLLIGPPIGGLLDHLFDGLRGALDHLIRYLHLSLQ